MKIVSYINRYKKTLKDIWDGNNDILGLKYVFVCVNDIMQKQSYIFNIIGEPDLLKDFLFFSSNLNSFVDKINIADNVDFHINNFLVNQHENNFREIVSLIKVNPKLALDYSDLFLLQTLHDCNLKCMQMLSKHLSLYKNHAEDIFDFIKRGLLEEVMILVKLEDINKRDVLSKQLLQGFSDVCKALKREDLLYYDLILFQVLNLKNSVNKPEKHFREIVKLLKQTTVASDDADVLLLDYLHDLNLKCMQMLSKHLLLYENYAEDIFDFIKRGLLEEVMILVKLEDINKRDVLSKQLLQGLAYVFKALKRADQLNYDLILLQISNLRHFFLVWRDKLPSQSKKEDFCVEKSSAVSIDVKNEQQSKIFDFDDLLKESKNLEEYSFIVFSKQDWQKNIRHLVSKDKTDNISSLLKESDFFKNILSFVVDKHDGQNKNNSIYIRVFQRIESILIDIMFKFCDENELNHHAKLIIAWHLYKICALQELSMISQEVNNEYRAYSYYNSFAQHTSACENILIVLKDRDQKNDINQYLIKQVLRFLYVLKNKDRPSKVIKLTNSEEKTQEENYDNFSFFNKIYMYFTNFCLIFYNLVYSFFSFTSKHESNVVKSNELDNPENLVNQHKSDNPESKGILFLLNGSL